MEIYSPAEDSYFFAEFIKDYLKQYKIKSYLDMGTGSGILAKEASNFIPKKNILCVDINPLAVSKLKKQGFNAIQSDLFKEIDQKFDLITFNAPYLPFDPREPKSSQVATTGGKKGDEISVKFIKEAKNHLNEGGKVFLLISSLTPFKKIDKFKPKIVAKKKIFMEELKILEFNFKIPI